MSNYITGQGHLVFRDESILMQAIGPLMKGGWLVEDEEQYIWQDETGTPLMIDNAVCLEEYLITIPCASYRNFSQAIDAAIALADSGQFKCYSTESISLKAWTNGEFIKVNDLHVIAKVARTSEQSDIDALSMMSDEWEAKYPEDDYDVALDGVMNAAFCNF
jgi:hypothetical protein